MQASELPPETPVWRPFKAQLPFLASSAYEALYGGAAGGGKTDSLVLGALRYVENPRYTAVIFRRTFGELEGKVIPVSQEWYPCAGGKYNGSSYTWTFPSGARIIFAHLQHEKDVLLYQGHEFQYIGFDELTHFTEKQYTYLLTRLRTTAGIPLQVRAGTNPGGPGHEWVFKRWQPWLDYSPEYKGIRARPGQALRYRNTPDGVEWASDGRFSRVFYPARATDNPHLNADYGENLMGQDRVTRAQLIDGDWLIKPSAGAYFKRSYFEIVDAAPADVMTRVRRWDLAATEAATGRDPDWTVGLKMSRTRNGVYFVEDVARFRESPHRVEFAIKTTAEMDGRPCRIHLPQDPGQAGKSQIAYFVKSLAGFDVRSSPETGDKVTRARPASAQAEAGNIKIVRGAWNEAFIQELEQFPDGGHDDQVDALSGAFSALLSSQVPAGVSADPFLDY